MRHPLTTLVLERFRREFGARPAVVARAPGRVNLIGEHTDYNDGFVLPLALDRAAWLACRPRADARIRVHALSFDETVEFDPTPQPSAGGADHWSDYVKGTAWSLRAAGLPVRGWDGVLGSDVPVAAGLSSSAAIELATARACAAISGFAWDPHRMAVLAQRAENEWVGVNCGIMDQLISAAAVEGHALLIDCRSLATTPVPVPPDVVIVVLDTATRRGLVDSAYNERRRQCEAAARVLGVPALRDVDAATLAASEGAMPDVVFRRARHVVTENARTIRAADLARSGDVRGLGRLLDESHASLRDDFEVSSPALDAIVGIARHQPGCVGARMTGAGFGGCALALVARDAVASFVDAVGRDYAKALSLEPAIYPCRPAGGASLVEVD